MHIPEKALHSGQRKHHGRLGRSGFWEGSPHCSAGEIAEEMFISINTVRTPRAEHPPQAAGAPSTTGRTCRPTRPIDRVTLAAQESRRARPGQQRSRLQTTRMRRARCGRGPTTNPRNNVSGGVRKGAGFIFGWLVSLAVVVAVTGLATGNNPPRPNTAPSLAALAVKIAIGVVLVGIAVRQRRKMGQPKKPKKPPKWQAGVDNMSRWYAIGLAPLLQPWGYCGRSRHRNEREAIQRRKFRGLVRVLRDRHIVVPHAGNLCRLSARREPDLPRQDQNLDQHAHRSSHHHWFATCSDSGL
jgi:Sap-like sulfolipid-1-addressing protein